MLKRAPPLHDGVSEELCGSCSWEIFLARSPSQSDLCGGSGQCFAEVADCSTA